MSNNHLTEQEIIRREKDIQTKIETKNEKQKNVKNVYIIKNTGFLHKMNKKRYTVKNNKYKKRHIIYVS